MIDIIFATSFSDLFRMEINDEISLIDLGFNITFCKRKQLMRERIRDHITKMMRLAFVSELSQRAVTDITFYLEISTALKTLKSVRRMFDPSTSDQFYVVPQLVDAWRSLDQIIDPPKSCMCIKG